MKLIFSWKTIYKDKNLSNKKYSRKLDGLSKLPGLFLWEQSPNLLSFVSFDLFYDIFLKLSTPGHLVGVGAGDSPTARGKNKYALLSYLFQKLSLVFSWQFAYKKYCVLWASVQLWPIGIIWPQDESPALRGIFPHTRSDVHHSISWKSAVPQIRKNCGSTSLWL